LKQSVIIKTFAPNSHFVMKPLHSLFQSLLCDSVAFNDYQFKHSSLMR